MTTSEQQAVPVAQGSDGFTLGMNVRIRDGVQHFGGLTGYVENIHEPSPRQYPIEVMLTDRKDSRCFRPHELAPVPLPCKSGEGAGGLEDIRRSMIRQLCLDPHDRISLPDTDWDIVLEALRPTLATVAAANDEGVALDWRAVAKLAGEHGVRYRTNTALEKFLAAIRLLSQGGGK